MLRFRGTCASFHRGKLEVLLCESNGEAMKRRLRELAYQPAAPTPTGWRGAWRGPVRLYGGGAPSAWASEEDGHFGTAKLAIPSPYSRDAGEWADLRGRTVDVEAEVRHFNFSSPAAHNAGERIVGARLLLRNIVAADGSG